MRVIKQIWVITFSLLMVFATGGIGLFQHYCACSGNSSTSILFEDIDCHINHICTTPFQEQKNSCCSATSKLQGATDHNCQNSHNCCKTDFKLLKTDFSYYKISNNHISFNPQIYCIITDNSEINEKQEIYQNREAFDDLPPPLYGRELLIKMHQLKISSPLA